MEDVEDEDIFSVVWDELSFLFFLLVAMTRHTQLEVAEEDWQNYFWTQSQNDDELEQVDDGDDEVDGEDGDHTSEQLQEEAKQAQESDRSHDASHTLDILSTSAVYSCHYHQDLQSNHHGGAEEESSTEADVFLSSHPHMLSSHGGTQTLS